MSTELATETQRAGFVLPVDTDIMRVTQAELNANEEFYEIPGFGLVSDKMTMIGVPFATLGLTFQQPVKDKANHWGERDYVSLYSIIGDSAQLEEAEKRGLIPSGKCAWNPGERVVINDGSTGIRRQIVQILHKWNIIKVAEISDTEKDAGVNMFDAPWTAWESFPEANEQGCPIITRNHNGNQFHINARRGLRVSEYTNDYGEGATFYL